MNIAELETAALSGKFRELLARDEEWRDAEGMKSPCRDKLSKRRATPRVNWLSAAILDAISLKVGEGIVLQAVEDELSKTSFRVDVGRRRSPAKIRPAAPNQLWSARKRAFIYRDLAVPS